MFEFDFNLSLEFHNLLILMPGPSKDFLFGPPCQFSPEMRLKSNHKQPNIIIIYYDIKKTRKYVMVTLFIRSIHNPE